VRMVLVAEDPDAVFKTVLDAGAAQVWPVADQDCGWRAGRLVDPFGIIGKLASRRSNCVYRTFLSDQKPNPQTCMLALC
jgi:uncharacterized glyoxalase superfamily protein PhnB